MRHIGVPDLAASQHHVVQIQGVTFPLPQHRPGELVQTVVGLLTIDQSYRQKRKKIYIQICFTVWFKVVILHIMTNLRFFLHVQDSVWTSEETFIVRFLDEGPQC